MATIPIRPQLHLVPAAAAAASSSKLRLFRRNLRALCTLTSSVKNRAPSSSRVRARARGPVLEELRENWLDSLSCPFPIPELLELGLKERDKGHPGKWVLGIDPDVSGALALLKDAGDGDASAFSAQVFDTPHLQVPVGKGVRKRLDVRSLVQLIHSFGAPLGTTAYIEQSTPFPQDGKQGWYSGGLAYGLWIGILVSSGFSVVPVPSCLWKDQFQLTSKDDSRKAASDLFPPLSSSLQRKKDHGRAEALLIAAYGKGLRLRSNTISTSTETPTSTPTLSL